MSSWSASSIVGICNLDKTTAITVPASISIHTSIDQEHIRHTRGVSTNSSPALYTMSLTPSLQNKRKTVFNINSHTYLYYHEFRGGRDS